jgi:hypothetical protein
MLDLRMELPMGEEPKPVLKELNKILARHDPTHEAQAGFRIQ